MLNNQIQKEIYEDQRKQREREEKGEREQREMETRMRREEEEEQRIIDLYPYYMKTSQNPSLYGCLNVEWECEEFELRVLPDTSEEEIENNENKIQMMTVCSQPPLLSDITYNKYLTIITKRLLKYRYPDSDYSFLDKYHFSSDRLILYFNRVKNTRDVSKREEIMERILHHIFL